MVAKNRPNRRSAVIPFIIGHCDMDSLPICMCCVKDSPGMTDAEAFALANAQLLALWH